MDWHLLEISLSWKSWWVRPPPRRLHSGDPWLAELYRSAVALTEREQAMPERSGDLLDAVRRRDIALTSLSKTFGNSAYVDCASRGASRSWSCRDRNTAGLPHGAVEDLQG